MGDQDSVGCLISMANYVGLASGGPFLSRLVVACTRQGFNAVNEVLPALAEALTTADRAVAGQAWYARWRLACRRLPLQLTHTCGPLLEQGRIALGLEGCLRSLADDGLPFRMYSELDGITSVIRTTSLTIAVQVGEG